MQVLDVNCTVLARYEPGLPDQTRLDSKEQVARSLYHARVDLLVLVILPGRQIAEVRARLGAHGCSVAELLHVVERLLQGR